MNQMTELVEKLSDNGKISFMSLLPLLNNIVHSLQTNNELIITSDNIKAIKVCFAELLPQYLPEELKESVTSTLNDFGMDIILDAQEIDNENS